MASGSARHEGVQHVGAMRVEHALGIAGGAGGVAHAGGGVLVEALPGEVAVDLADPFLVGHGVLAATVCGMCAASVSTMMRSMVGSLSAIFSSDRHEGQVDEHHAVLGMVDDPGDLVGEQPRVDRVVDRADAHDAVPGLDMPPGVPGQRRRRGRPLDAVAFEPLRHLQRAGADRRVVGRARSVPRPSAMTISRSPCWHRGMVDDAWHSSGHSCISPSMAFLPLKPVPAACAEWMQEIISQID